MKLILAFLATLLLASPTMAWPRRPYPHPHPRPLPWTCYARDENNYVFVGRGWHRDTAEIHALQNCQRAWPSPSRICFVTGCVLGWGAE
jgi:hypothetical protein